jgi:hypothetical protein
MEAGYLQLSGQRKYHRRLPLRAIPSLTGFQCPSGSGDRYRLHIVDFNPRQDQ